MAILKGIDVTVRVNEQPLHEYNDDEDDNGEDNAITRYVEATSGAQFSIDYEASASFKLVTDVVAVEFRLDGGLVDTAIHRKEKLSNYRSLDGSWSSAFYGTREPVGKGWRMRPFIFEEIAIGKQKLLCMIVGLKLFLSGRSNCIQTQKSVDYKHGHCCCGFLS